MVGIHEAAKFLGVAAQTLRRWEREGMLIPDEGTLGVRRRYDLAWPRRARSVRRGVETLRDIFAYCLAVVRRLRIFGQRYKLKLTGPKRSETWE